MKRCPKCGEEKPLDNFSFDKSRRDGKHCYCKPCQSLVVKAGKRKISFEEALAFDQVPLCQACGEPIGGGLFSHLDHCHNTDDVRGVLCPDCNRVVTAFDKKHKLASLLIYLWRHEERMSV
jgi:adenine-specific DNA methylase